MLSDQNQKSINLLMIKLFITKFIYASLPYFKSLFKSLKNSIEKEFNYSYNHKLYKNQLNLIKFECILISHTYSNIYKENSVFELFFKNKRPAN